MESLLYMGASNTVMATALAVLAAVAGAVARRPALAHGLWLLVLLKLVTPPFVQLPILPASSAVEEESVAAEDTLLVTSEELQQILGESQTADAISDKPPTSGEEADGTYEPRPLGSGESAPPRSRLFNVLGALWLAGSAGWFLLAAYRIGRFRRLLRHAKAVPPGLQAEVGRLAKRLGLRRCPDVRFVPGPVSPMLWSLGGPPLLLLPKELWERLTDEQRQTLAAHELAHLARRDHWVRGLEFLATGLYWWNPLIWWARHGLREAEERCCDAWVVWALPAAARSYATALVETVDFLSEARPVLPAAASGIGHVRILKRRLTMILQGTTPRALSATGFLALAVMAALMLPLLPTWAQAPPAPPKTSAPAKDVIWVEVEGKKIEQDKVELHLRHMLMQLLAAQREDGAGEGLDRAITELKKKLAELEAKRARENPKKTEEIEKARAEVKAAEIRLAHARARLAQLEGLKIQVEFNPGELPKALFELRKRVETKDRKEGREEKQDRKEGRDKTERKDANPGDGEANVRKALELLRKMQGVKPANKEERLERLEKQLTELLREVKELRKEPKKPGRPSGRLDPQSPPGSLVAPAAVTSPPVAR